MTRLDYQNICRAASAGDTITLENRNSHEQGRIISCHSDYFNVQLEQGWRIWSREECEEAENEGGKIP